MFQCHNVWFSVKSCAWNRGFLKELYHNFEIPKTLNEAKREKMMNEWKNDFAFTIRKININDVVRPIYNIFDKCNDFAKKHKYYDAINLFNEEFIK